MPTTFQEIYTQFLSKIEDYELGALSEIDALELLFSFMKSSIVDFKKCKKDINDFIPFTSNKFNINFNGSDSVSFISNLTMTNSNLVFEVYNGDILLTQGVDYNLVIASSQGIISNISIIKLNNELPDILTVVWAFGGQFKVTLTLEEQEILALGIVVAWLNHKILREQNLKQIIGNTDYKGFSPANLIAKLSALQEQYSQEIKAKRISYSYNNFTGLN